jgi:LAS superfamily LD-carboxypeptidase LdcB
MKKLFILIASFTFLLLSLHLNTEINTESVYAESRANVRFILPEGHPYKNVGLSSGEVKEVYLKFGDSLTVKDKSLYGSIIWYHCSRGNFLFYLPDVFVVEEPGKIAYDKNRNIQIGREVVDRWTALPIHYKPNDLIRLPTSYISDISKNRKILLRKTAALQFMSLIDAAEKEGLKIRIVSAYRDPRYQSYLYMNAIKKNGFFQTSVAKPGHSEHHLGTTCDLTSDDVSTGLTADFADTAAFKWLKENIHKYGIYLSYPKYKTDITGYEYEPWHFRYWGEDRWEGDVRFNRTFIHR